MFALKPEAVSHSISWFIPGPTNVTLVLVVELKMHCTVQAATHRQCSSYQAYV